MSPTIGSGRLWFPSRRSVAIQRGAFSITLSGHWRFGSLRGGNRLYLFEGSLSLLRSVKRRGGEMGPDIHRHGGVVDREKKNSYDVTQTKTNLAD